MKEKLYPVLAALSFLLSQNADHLLLTRIVTHPNSAESISIVNPTSSDVNLKNYYLCDDEEYYKIQTEGEMSPSHIANGLTAKFPETNLAAGDTLHLVLDENYSDFYGTSFTPHFYLFGSESNSMLETEPGSFGGSSNKLNDDAEMIILFYWDGNAANPVKDVDYFLWGNAQNAVDKSSLPGYYSDTPAESQSFFQQTATEFQAYTRKNLTESGESSSNGNGITGHDETSENFIDSWEVTNLFILGCTNTLSSNFDPEAEKDDGSCLTPYTEILNGDYDCGTSSNGYCDGSPSCSEIRIQGTIVDYFDVTVYGGPHAITLEDDKGYRLEVTIWPSEWDIANDDSSVYLITPPFKRFYMEAVGSVFEYNGEKQILICSQEDFTLKTSFDQEGYFSQDNDATVSILPSPFILIPSLGESLDYSYSFEGGSRVIIRIFDVSGRFITSLVDKYYPQSGTVSRHEQSSAWDGRDHLGQIAAPGTYIMHIETQNPQTGETQSDAAPVVIGVQN